MKIAAVVLVFVTFFACVMGAPLWKVFCQNTPVFRGRADPIVNPGNLAQHSHKVFGASNFDMSNSQQTPIQYYDQMVASNCTTCSITIDKSAYWVPDLYYRWPNGTLSLVPNGGLTVYYPSRQGYGSQANPQWKAIPPGLRIVAGSSGRRTYNASILSNAAVSYACLSSTSSKPETGEFPTATQFCNNGLRAQVWFPMCWDGVNLDYSDHFSHMAYPDGLDGGNCPSSHPVRIPGIFYELLFSVSSFPHGNGVQPFVWSNGDTTGNGLHGDFVSGWDPVIMQNAIGDPTCDINNTNFGNTPQNCKPFTPYVKINNPDQSCVINHRLPITEDLGVNHLLSHLPGCNPILNYAVPACTGQWPQQPEDNNRRVAIFSAINGQYWSVGTQYDSLTANTPAVNLSYWNMFTLEPQPASAGPNLLAIQSDIFLNYMSDNNRGGSPFKFNRNSPSGWEYFTINYINGTGPSATGTPATILANSNGKYLQIQPDSTIWSNAATVNPNCIFMIVDPNAAVIDTRTSTQYFVNQGQGPSNLESEQGANGASALSSSLIVLFAIIAFIAM